MLQPGRTYSATPYRYGFNGKEKDNEIKGEGNQLDYGMRVYDPRAGKFLSVDPLTPKYPELTPYQYASNRPIDGVDLDGLEWNSNNDQKGRIRNATQSDWDNNPGKAFLKDASAYLLNWFTPAGAIDDAVDTWRNPKSTTREKGQAVMDVLMAPGFPGKPNSGHVQTETPAPASGVHLPERPVVESPNSTQPVNATNKNATTAHSGNPGAAKANSAKSDPPRFFVDGDGTVVDTKTTPKGSYVHPNGDRTDVLQKKTHYNKVKGENHGRSHTHPLKINTDKQGKNHEYHSEDTHKVTPEEVENIKTGKATKSF